MSVTKLTKAEKEVVERRIKTSIWFFLSFITSGAMAGIAFLIAVGK